MGEEFLSLESGVGAERDGGGRNGEGVGDGGGEGLVKRLEEMRLNG